MGEDTIKMKGYKRAGSCLAGVLILLLGGPFSVNAQGEAPSSGLQMIHPQKLSITSFYHGEPLAVRALVPADHEVAIRIIGPEEDLHLLEKGRVWGLWMNVRQVVFHHVPKVYLLLTTKRLPALADEKTVDRLKLDYGSLLSGSVEAEEPSRKSFLIDQLIKLKEHDRLYQMKEGIIQIKPLSGGNLEEAEVDFPLPARMAPGSYALELISFHDGDGALLQRKMIEVQLSGLTGLLHRLAEEKGLLYGIVAVIIAMACGLAIGVIFTSKGAH